MILLIRNRRTAARSEGVRRTIRQTIDIRSARPTRRPPHRGTAPFACAPEGGAGVATHQYYGPGTYTADYLEAALRISRETWLPIERPPHIPDKHNKKNIESVADIGRRISL